MDCREVRSLADSYLSGQLPAGTAHALVEHAERCQACRAEVEGRLRMRDGLRSAFERSPELQPRPGFVEALHARLHERATADLRGRSAEDQADRPRAPGWRRVAMVASVMLALGTGGALWVARDALRVLAAHAAGDHQNCALEFRLHERPITLTEAAARFDPAFGRLETAEFPGEALGRSALEHVERHACVYDGQPFAHLVFRYKGTVVSVLVPDGRGSRTGWWQGRRARELPAVGTFKLVSFRTSQHAVFVVSTLPTADVHDVAQAITSPIGSALAGS